MDVDWSSWLVGLTMLLEELDLLECGSNSPPEWLPGVMGLWLGEWCLGECACGL